MPGRAILGRGRRFEGRQRQRIVARKTEGLDVVADMISQGLPAGGAEVWRAEERGRARALGATGRVGVEAGGAHERTKRQTTVG